VTLKLKANIIGYNEQGGQVTSLIVAVSSASGWRVPAMSVPVPSDAAVGLLQRLERINRAEPFVANHHSATWVEPVFRCSIQAEFEEQQERFESIALLKVH
jgi:hypothetical protein